MRIPLVTGVLFLVAACETAAAPPAASPPSPPTASTTPTTHACLMTHICGCNLGCARVPLDRASLREGARGIAETGPYKGQEMMVVKEADATGAGVFVLSDRGPAGACELATPSKSLLGFACAEKDSGPVPARACAMGCEP